ncbi:MAG: ORF6N domain-containing protein [Acidobacteriota bacterium]|nr:ORF6N domain-containing protein [Acidobacteriota bacterium]
MPGINLKSQFVASSWGGARRAMPYAFTEQGVAMLSSVLRNQRALQVKIAIMRAFVRHGAAGEKSDGRIRFAHGLGKGVVLQHVIPEVRVADLPEAVHLVSNIPEFHAVWLGVAVCRLQSAHPVSFTPTAFPPWLDFRLAPAGSPSMIKRLINAIVQRFAEATAAAFLP